MIYIDELTHKPCPTLGKTLCTITDKDHKHIALYTLKMVCVHEMNPRWCATCNGDEAKAKEAEQQDDFLDNLIRMQDES